jgi:hypothetical protein
MAHRIPIEAFHLSKAVGNYVGSHEPYLCQFNLPTLPTVAPQYGVASIDHEGESNVVDWVPACGACVWLTVTAARNPR